MRTVFGKLIAVVALAPLLAGCESSPAHGPVSVKTIQPTGEHCKYAIQPTTLLTLEDLSQVSGRIGRVVTSGLNLDSSAAILDDAVGFRPIDAQFLTNGGVYTASDYATLSAVSLYYAIETGYLLHARLSPETDFATRQSDFAGKTLIVYDAYRTFQDAGATLPMKDNAEYLAHVYTEGGARQVRNYFFSYPSDSDIKDMPLGLNLGIMVHEYTHLVFQYQFYEKGYARNISTISGSPTDNLLLGIDEGIADYFGYLATKDPGYFLCTFPTEARDLSVPKDYTAQLDASLKSGGSSYDPHEVGAVFAAINYEIGKAMGSQEENARSVQKLMSYLLDCPAAQQGGGTLTLTFQTVAQCHLSAADPARASLMKGIYNSHLKAGGGIP